MRDFSFLLPLLLQLYKLQSVCFPGVETPTITMHIFEAFANLLHAKLHKAFEVPARKFQRRREKMWGSYHSMIKHRPDQTNRPRMRSIKSADIEKGGLPIYPLSQREAVYLPTSPRRQY